MSLTDTLRAGVTTRSPEETQAVAAAWAAELPRGSTVALHGDLGVGKTTFVQGFARGLGVTGAVTSPTFTVLNLYRAGEKTLAHLDAYRLSSDAEVDALMVDDFLRDPWWMLVEWPDRFGRGIPSDALHLELSILPDRRHALRLR
jgi:tRNA threonylcarbamoyladenosine biosynthesis protein TsaE